MQLVIQQVERVGFHLPAADAGMTDVKAGDMDLWDGKCSSNAKMPEITNRAAERNRHTAGALSMEPGEKTD